MQDIEFTCKIEWYTIIMLSLSFLGIVTFIVLKDRKLKLFRGHLFSKFNNAGHIKCSALCTYEIV